MIFKRNQAPTVELVRAFDALGDTTRYHILILIRHHPGICVSELAKAVGITPAGTSMQLKILERVGLVERQRKGQRICYRVDRKSTMARQLLRFINRYERQALQLMPASDDSNDKTNNAHVY